MLKASNDSVLLKHHLSAFQRNKDTISKNTALRYYDAKQDLYLEVDASTVGLSAVILQSLTDQKPNNSDNGFIPTDLQPVAYACKSVITIEQNYVNIEREISAVLHGLEKFHCCIYT